MISIALALAVKAHRHQEYSTGVPYINHCMRVAVAVEDKWGYDEKLIAAALLHDVLEDTTYSRIDLLQAGLSFDIVYLVHTLTHYGGELYLDYIDRVCENLDAAKIKYCDMSDNIRHLGKLTVINPGKARELTHKYREAILKLALTLGADDVTTI